MIKQKVDDKGLDYGSNPTTGNALPLHTKAASGGSWLVELDEPLAEAPQCWGLWRL